MRADGRRLKTLDPYFEIVPYIMNKRVDAQNAFHDDIPLAPMERYITEKRKEGVKISHMAVLITAYLHVLAEYPALNRFVVNKKIYARNHICVSFVVLKKNSMSKNASPTVVKAYFKGNENIFEVSQQIEEIIASNVEDDFENPMDKLLKKVFRIPGLVSFAVGGYKLLDRWSLLPRSVIDGSPFHTSLFITNMASLRSNYIYHHLYEFGTTSIFIAMGKFRNRVEMKGDEPQEARYLPLGITTDERIVEGDYYAMCFHKIAHLLADPCLLEVNVTPVEDVG